MAGLPDVLTDEQMDKLGGKPYTGAPSKVPAPNESGKLPVEEPLTDDQVAYRQHLAGIHEQPLIHVDPAMDVFTMMAGGAAGKLAARGIRMGAKGAIGGLARLSPVVADLAEPAIASGTTSALQGGNLKQNLIAGGIGGLLGVPGAALGVVRRAPGAVNERLTRAVTGGLKGKAAQNIVASDSLEEVAAAHPELRSVLSSGASPAEKFNATSATMGKLTAANDAVYDAIQATHQGIPLDPIAKKIQAVAEKAHAEGDEVVEKAAASAIENLQRYGDVADKRGLVATATQVRGVRNNLARKVQALNPTMGPTEAQAAADQIKRAINEGIEDVAAQTKGVDVKALRERNQQIAALMPVQQTLRQRAIAAGLNEGQDPLAEFIHGPKHVIAGLVNKAPAAADAAIADNATLQRFATGRAGKLLSSLPAAAPLAGSAVARKVPQDELEYTARVAQFMKAGLSLKDAMEKANEQ